ncbi:MAG: quinone-dependent dihydroorotate dehydrogenase [Cytophagales bacterium]|nr:MAG: quinone-dependent dihydroorotate dehydrogenase [Cytophagales bacterium]
MYKLIIKPLLFLKQAEDAHHFTFKALKNISKFPGISSIIRAIYQLNSPKLSKTVFGLNFPNPVGLAAGFDKDAKCIDELANFGFGFIEIGTLTPKPQAGNDKPRLFRLVQDEAIINRMGFNNQGVDTALLRLAKRKSKIIVGGNIGKNKITPNEDAIADYEYCFNALFDEVDYFVVNVSSPNTPGLRELQEKEPLTKLLTHINQLNFKRTKPKPILLKIAPDLSFEQLDDIVTIVKETQIAGLIATNTTISRAGLMTSASELEKIGAGGLSGKPLAQKSTEVIRYLAQKSKGAFPIIAVGGIHTAEDALEKFKAGASLVQLYTGFIYEGPSLIKKINKLLIKTNILN